MAKKEKQKGSGLFSNILNKVKEKAKQLFAPKHEKPKQPQKEKPKHKEPTNQEPKPKQTTTQYSQQSPKPKESKQVQQIKKDIQQKREELTPPEPETPHVETTSTDRSLFTTVTIEHYRAELKRFPNSAEPKLSGWLDSLIVTHGEDAVAQMIQDATADGVELTSDIAYSKELATYVADLINYLPDMTDWAKADLLDEFETWDDLL